MFEILVLDWLDYTAHTTLNGYKKNEKRKVS